MPVITLKPKESRPIKTGGLFLSIVESSSRFVVESPEIGTLAGEVGRQFKVPNINQVFFVNETEQSIDIEYESSNIEVSAGTKGIVSVGNSITVQRIIEAIQVDANATVENGKMALLPASGFAPIDDVNIAPGQTELIVNSRQATNRKVTLQVITDDTDMSTVRMGTSPVLSDGQGIFLQGNKNAVSGYEFSTEQAVYVRNTGDKTATITGGEAWR